MLAKIPNPMRLNIIEEPPYEISGIGTPVKGMSFVIAATLTKNCNAIQEVIPTASIFPKRSGVFLAISKPL